MAAVESVPLSEVPPVAARPRTLVLLVTAGSIEAAMLGPTGTELGAHVHTMHDPAAPLAPTLQALWPALERLGEFDRITVSLGAGLGETWTPAAVVAVLEDQSGRRARAVTTAALRWQPLIQGVGVELVLVLDAALASALFLDGTLVPGLDLGRLRARKRRTYAEYLAPRIATRKSAHAWGKRVRRVVDDVLAAWSPRVLYLVGPGAALLEPDLELPSSVVVIREAPPLAGALALWTPTVSPPG